MNDLLLELYSFGALCVGIVPAHPSDRGGIASQHQCPRCKSRQIAYKLHDSWLQFDLRKRYIPAYWPDIFASHIFHERVIKVLREEVATGFNAYPMRWEKFDEWAEVIGPKARKLVLPTYYRIEVLGRVDVNIFEIDNGEGSVCPECHAWLQKRSPNFPWSPKRIIPQSGTWDGSDFCNWRNLVHGTSLCSRRVIDLAARHRWTSAFGDSTPGVAIRSPVALDWFERVGPRIRELHPDQFAD